MSDINLKYIVPGAKIVVNYQYPPNPKIYTVKSHPYIWYNKEGQHIEISVIEKDSLNINIEDIIKVIKK